MDQCTRGAGGTDRRAVISRDGWRPAPRVHWSMWLTVLWRCRGGAVVEVWRSAPRTGHFRETDFRKHQGAAAAPPRLPPLRRVPMQRQSSPDARSLTQRQIAY